MPAILHSVNHRRLNTRHIQLTAFAGSIGAYVPIMAITWILFNAAMKAQDIDKETFLPVRSRFQPDTGYWAFCCAFTFLW